MEGIQHWALGQFGDSWCDEFAVGFVLDICFQGNSPFPRQADVDDATTATLDYARKMGWVVIVPVPGDLVFSVTPDGKPHHVAICAGWNPLTTIAGNTSADGASSNGDRVGEHPVGIADKVFVHYPREWPIGAHT